jgi:hypothetical protein
MANVYVCRIRTDIPAGTLQLTDLRPNSSQYSIYQAPARGFYATTPGGTADASAYGQSGYLGLRVENDTVAALVANATVASYDGLAAYLIDHCIDQVTGVTITVTVANAAAIAFVAQADAGGSIDINAAMVTTGGAGAATTLTNAAGSNGTLAAVLQILSGARYNLPSGSTVGALGAGAQLGAFDYMVDDRAYRQLYDSNAFQSSVNQGSLSALKNAAWSYEVDGVDVAGAAVVSYDASGTAL